MVWTGKVEEGLELMGRENVTDLHVGGIQNEIHDDGIEKLSVGLSNNSQLRILSLWDNQITEKGVKVLCEALTNNNSIQKLSLDHNQIGVEGGRYLGQMLHTSSIQIVNLKNNKLENSGTENLFKELSKSENRNLQVLNLWGNSLNNGAVPSLIEYLSKNPFLQVLYLNGNEIDEEGAAQIAEAVVNHNTRLVKLDLSKNPCKVPKSLQEKLNSNRILYDKCKTRITETLGTEIEKEINFSPDDFEAVSQITYLDLSFSQLDVISPEIGKFQNLRVLKLSHNKLNALPNSIKELKHLEVLDLRGNLFEAVPEFLNSHFPNLTVKM